MDLNTLRDALMERPFEPFTIRLADGRSETVNHPEFVAVGPRVVVVVREDNSILTVEPPTIVSLVPVGGASKNDNGSVTKRKENSSPFEPIPIRGEPLSATVLSERR